MGWCLAEVAAPELRGFQRCQGVIDIVGMTGQRSTQSHLYQAGDQPHATEEGITIAVGYRFPAFDTDHLSLRIGMIDSRVDVSHPALHDANIHTTLSPPRVRFCRAFTARRSPGSLSYGGGYTVSRPAPKYMLASHHHHRFGCAGLVDIFRVDVINISLAGPLTACWKPPCSARFRERCDDFSQRRVSAAGPMYPGRLIRR